MGWTYGVFKELMVFIDHKEVKEKDLRPVRCFPSRKSFMVDIDQRVKLFFIFFIAYV